jgi:hypothetical protein
MALLDLWNSNPNAISSFSIEQIVTSAGDGKFKDNTLCSKEVRTYLSQISSSKLFEYVNYCLSNAFNKSGEVLQDIVNELGRRLDYQVTNGNYQGTKNKIGFDGIWVSPEQQTIVVEVKTTDAYRISLDTLARYRNGLLKNEAISQPCSILIVVGRHDTGELEAQIRGSRHAWDIRLISTDALEKMVKVKENTDEPETGKKIRSILIPREYTKLDEMVEVIFTATKDIEIIPVESEQPGGNKQKTEPTKKKSDYVFTDSSDLQVKREIIVEAMGRREKTRLIKKTRAAYWDSDHSVRMICTISKRYNGTGNQVYWYAYHPTWDQFLGEGRRGYFVLGCMDLDLAFAIPLEVVRTHLSEFNTTVKDDGTMYWHIKIIESPDHQYALHLPKSSSISLMPYACEL